MALFGGSDINPSKSETTVISAGARIDGEFDFESMLHIDGEISGKIRSKSVVTIGKEGVLKGELFADRVVVNGYFEGDLNATSLEILAGGVVNGTITIAQLGIENGGKFNGTSKFKESVEPIQTDNNEDDA